MFRDAQLIPYVYIMPPQDGIYDYTFVARPPKWIPPLTDTPIKASYRLPPGPPAGMKGVRIHAEQNTKEAMFDKTEPAPEPVKNIG